MTTFLRAAPRRSASSVFEFSKWAVINSSHVPVSVMERFEQIYGRTLPFILHSEQYMQLRADSVIWANNDSSTALSENGS
ncbi:hypothetical protein IMY05_014G0036500 [Salix suchowensis]|nr:hypothetical protein IMY05_014G0036500 [Salix suchowensis]